MTKPVAILTDDEVEILAAGKENANIITDYFFRQPGAEHGWIFDENFDPEGAWQETVHFAAQERIVVIGGFGSGKTRGVAISGCVWCMTTSDFAFMNAAPHSWQSELMYKFILQRARGTRFEDLIWSSPKRPYPTIEIRFIVKGVLIISTMEFMSVDKNANAILSWEGDWVNIDEAGLLDDLEGTITNLGTRLRGTVNGRERLGRMSLTSNSWDNPELWYRYELASSVPEDYLSLTISSRHNHNVTDRQLKQMLRDIPEEEHDRFIDGARPEGRGSFFNKERVYQCEDQLYGDLILENYKSKVVGYGLSSMYGAGITYFATPRVPKHTYILLGDPGTENAPTRNAPCLMLWDVTDFPKYKAILSAFWWGNGHGSITPFISMMFTLMQMYDPVFTGTDSTGPQKNTNEIINTYIMGARVSKDQRSQWIGEIDFSKITNPFVSGLDFSGSKKPAYLIAGRLMIEATMLVWPKLVVGIRSQLTNYDPEKDHVGKPKIPQDIVATLCMSAFVIRTMFLFDPENLGKKDAGEEDIAAWDFDARARRLADSDREIRIPAGVSR